MYVNSWRRQGCGRQEWKHEGWNVEVFTSPNENCSQEQGSTHLSQVHKNTCPPTTGEHKAQGKQNYKQP